ncbi:FAD-binding protein [Roseomonas sp. M0104]|uniref:FAD-binding protein n=1 Tax=Teichococcus coralli TaxID=2545983 RepID=A0A845BFD2_9PROT|nr:FAD-dependent oxidoreductase [Pseudoroseomonas coralli]MXP63952.1 FAD-binding protein [Pseudoroseomonas coralli]
MPDHDVAIIGAGAAGLSVAAMAASLGRKVVLFERERMGGECLNTGCVPSKALLAAAKRAVAVRDAARFGVHAADVRVDWQGVRRHVLDAIARIAPNDSAERFAGMGVEVVRASAHFVAPDQIEAGGRIHRFRRAVIAAGSAPVVPDLQGLVSCPWLTHETLFDLAEAPAHLLILGGGSQGAELAQAYARLGCRVGLIEARPNILASEDAELRLPLREALRQDGVTIHENTRAIGAERAPEGVALVIEGGARIAGSHLLFALGRTPRLAPLDLAAANIAASPDGVLTGPDLRSTTNRRVWAAGDVANPEGIGPRRFTHAASLHASVVVRSMLFRRPARLDYAALPRVTYTSPELAQVGLTEAEANAAGHSVRVLRHPFTENDRAVAEGETEGQVKLVVSKLGRLLGASVLGEGAGEMAGLFGMMISRKLPLSALAELVLPYPTRAEAAKRAAGGFYTPALTSSAMRGIVGLLNRLP